MGRHCGGELVIVPKFVGYREIAHTVAFGGWPALAAGEAEIAYAEVHFVDLDIN